MMQMQEDSPKGAVDLSDAPGWQEFGLEATQLGAPVVAETNGSCAVSKVAWPVYNALQVS